MTSPVTQSAICGSPERKKMFSRQRAQDLETRSDPRKNEELKSSHVERCVIPEISPSESRKRERVFSRQHAGDHENVSRLWKDGTL